MQGGTKEVRDKYPINWQCYTQHSKVSWEAKQTNTAFCLQRCSNSDLLFPWEHTYTPPRTKNCNPSSLFFAFALRFAISWPSATSKKKHSICFLTNAQKKKEYPDSSVHQPNESTPQKDWRPLFFISLAALF
jgi:endogenous inhibitor of DNA gyrase (YacG/DUF329 family)